MIVLGASASARPRREDALERVRAACKDLRGVTYFMTEHRGSGDDQCILQYSARQARADDDTSIGFTEGLFRFDGTIEQGGKKESFAICYDGEKLFVRNPGEAEAIVIDAPTTADLLRALDPRLQMLGVPPLTAAAPFENSPDGRTVLHAEQLPGETRIADVVCVNLKIKISAIAPDGSQHDIESIWAVGKDDSLPRMRESEFGKVELRDLKVLGADGAADRTAFAIQSPATSPSAPGK